MDLDGKLALVAGGTFTIGRAIFHSNDSRGAEVVAIRDVHA